MQDLIRPTNTGSSRVCSTSGTLQMSFSFFFSFFISTSLDKSLHQENAESRSGLHCFVGNIRTKPQRCSHEISRELNCGNRAVADGPLKPADRFTLIHIQHFCLLRYLHVKMLGVIVLSPQSWVPSQCPACQFTPCK